jgi:hypothetical protein
LFWRPLTARTKNHFLCDLCVFAVRKRIVSIFLKKTTKKEFLEIVGLVNQGMKKEERRKD